MTGDTNDGWIRLLEEMDEMEAALEREGWETLSIPAGDTAAVGPGAVAEHHGYAYVGPGDRADAFEALFVPDGFSRTEIYRQTAAGQLYLLTVSFDPPTRRAVLLAGLIEVGSLAECRRHARETGRMYSHVLRVDGTVVGSFEHDDPEPFFPE